MSSERTSKSKQPISDTEEKIKSLLKNLSAEIEREILIKECRQATSNPPLDIAA